MTESEWHRIASSGEEFTTKHDLSTWDGIDRRKNSVPTPGPNAGTSDAAFLQYIVAQLEAINAKMDSMHAEHGEMKEDVKSIKEAFPKDEDGAHDFDGHCDYHDALIKNAKSWGEILQDVKKKVFGGIAWATICFIAYALWQAIKEDLHR